MQVTFDKGSKKFVTKALGTLRGRNCYFCGTPLNQSNFAGAIKLDKPRMFCDSLPCLLELSDLERANEKDKPTS